MPPSNLLRRHYAQIAITAWSQQDYVMIAGKVWGSTELIEANGAAIGLRLGILLLTPDLGLDCAYLG